MIKWNYWYYKPYHPDGVSRYYKSIGPAVSENWVSLDQVSSSCQNLILFYEDEEFFQHKGFNLRTLRLAYKLNKSENYKKFGGSTITQQLVKNLFLSRKKSYTRKIREIIGAYLLNHMVSKNKQLEWYLNTIEYGPNIYGIKDAANYYFNTQPDKLNNFQCLEIALLLTSPVKHGENLKNAVQSGQRTALAQKEVDDFRSNLLKYKRSSINF